MLTKDQKIQAFRNELWRQVHVLENSKIKRDRMLASVLYGTAQAIVDVIEDEDREVCWHDVENAVSDIVQRNWHNWKEGPC